MPVCARVPPSLILGTAPLPSPHLREPMLFFGKLGRWLTLGTEEYHLPTVSFQHLPLILSPRLVSQTTLPLLTLFLADSLPLLISSPILCSQRWVRLRDKLPLNVNLPCQPVIFSLPKLPTLLFSGFNTLPGISRSSLVGLSGAQAAKA